MSGEIESLWEIAKEWHGRVAKLTHVFYKAKVEEIEGVGIFWTVRDSGELVANGTEKDFGTAMHKAERTFVALTEGY